MKKATLLTIFFFSLAVSTIFAETDESNFSLKRHQVGVRLGTWINSGDTPPASIVNPATNDSLTTSIKDVNFYIEGFYAYNIYSSLFSEISFGMVNRGNIQFHSSNLFDLSNVIIYPILFQLKYFPFHKTSSTFQPFIGGGGGFYFGTQDIQVSNDYYARYRNTDRETDINYTLSGGFDWLVRDNFSIELQTKYMPIHFSEYFIGEKDYSATTITIGFKYKYNNIKKK